MVGTGILSNNMRSPSPECYTTFWVMTIYSDTLLGLASVLMLRPMSPELVLFQDFWVSNIPRYFCFCFYLDQLCSNDPRYDLKFDTRWYLWHVKRCNIWSFLFILYNFLFVLYNFLCVLYNFPFILYNFLFILYIFLFVLYNFHLYCIISYLYCKTFIYIV